jgi:hypothetical protein
MTPFQARLKREFEFRKEKNRRFSLRSFATFLGADHSTVSQVLRARRRVTTAQIFGWGKKLGMCAEELEAYVAAEKVDAPSVSSRQEQLRHWTAEALAILNERSHWQIMQLSHSADAKFDSRWVADQIGASPDEVNLALTRLLRLRLLEIGPSGRWISRMRSEEQSEAAFMKRALARVRELATSESVYLPEA